MTDVSLGDILKSMRIHRDETEEKSDISVIDGAMVFMTTLKNSGNSSYIPDFLRFIDSNLGQDVYEELLGVMLNPTPTSTPKDDSRYFLTILCHHDNSDKIDAIKHIREFTRIVTNAGYGVAHLTLKEAKDLVDNAYACEQTLRNYPTPIDIIRYAVTQNNLSNYFHLTINPA